MNRLVADLQSAGVLIEEVKPSKVSVRNWRAMTESALKDAEDRLLRLKRIEAGFAQHVANESTLKSVSGQLSKLLVYTKERTDEHRRQREQRDKLMDRFKKEQSILSECNARLAALRQLTELQEAFRKTNSSLDQWRRVLKSSIEAADAATKELQPLLEAVASQRAKVANLRGVIQTRSHRIAALKVIRGGCSVWEKNCAEINNLQQTADDIRRTIKDYLIRIEQAKNGITNNEKQLAMNERQYRATTADQAKMTQLLDQIEAYVESGVCPVCGVDHKSKPVLIQRIRKQKQDRPAHVEALAKNCNDLRESIKKENATLDGLSANCAAKDKELKRITNKLTETRTSVAVFEQTVSAAGFLLSQQLGLVLDDELAREESILELDQKEVRSAEVQLGDATKRITELEQRLNAQTEAQERASHAITPFEQRSADVVAKVEALGLSLEMTSESLNEECTEVTSKVAVVEERMRRLSSEIDPISRAVDHLQVELTATDTKINDLRQDKKSVEEELLRYEEDAASIVGREGLSVDVISEQRAAASDRVDILEPLRRRCVMLERTIDAVQRSAMLAELEAQSQSLKKRKQALDISLERMSLVRKWFAGVKEVLDRQSSNAVANHVNAFGPLTSLIQKRLRSVYGFGDVNLSSVENEIRVSVGWEDKKLRPVDYFSDSQKQILMLSLFLAGRLTQNWSGFAPILMDDPVTHFDDLNAFGFVELIRGLVSTSPGKRQFFISTCEDRLFDLMIQKFHDVEGGSRFYRFRGAGPDGPIVETVGK